MFFCVHFCSPLDTPEPGLSLPAERPTLLVGQPCSPDFRTTKTLLDHIKRSKKLGYPLAALCTAVGSRITPDFGQFEVVVESSREGFDDPAPVSRISAVREVIKRPLKESKRKASKITHQFRRRILGLFPNGPVASTPLVLEKLSCHPFL